MRSQLLGLTCLCSVGLVLMSNASLTAAEKPGLTIDSVAIVPEIQAGDYRKVAWFGCVMVEMRGHLIVPDAPGEIECMPTLEPRLQLPAMNERRTYDAWCLGVGVVDDDGKVHYPCLTRPSNNAKESFTAKLPSGAGIETPILAGGNQQIKVFTSDTPIALAFYVPAKQPELKLTVQFSPKNERAAVPPLTITTKDLGWPIPANKQKDAKITFAAKLPFFIWSDKPQVQASEDYLRYAVNPDLALDAVPDYKDLATSAAMVINQPGPGGMVSTPFTSTVNEEFGISWLPNQFKGRGKAVLTILKRSDDPKNAENAPALSNRLNLQLSFDPPLTAKTRKTKPKKGR